MCIRDSATPSQLHQSREATALKLVDAVDIEGNVQGSTSLPEIICKFCLFLLEQAPATPCAPYTPYTPYTP
eukprot:4981996-Prymnesium_polylepis.1